MARFEVRVMPWAVTDVRNQYAYFVEHELFQTADAFEARVRKGLAVLADGALEYQLLGDGTTRRCPLEPFRHGIIYEVDGSTVVVHAVAHPAQMPRDWRQRSRE